VALAIYQEKSTGVYEKISLVSETVDKMPITTVHNGETGDSVELKLYVRADDTKVYYSSITAYPENLTATNYINGTSTGWGIKMRVGGIQPTPSEWEKISYGNTISFSNIGTSSIGNISTFLPFWVRIECPSNSPIRVKEGTSITLSYTENLIM